MLQVTHDGGDTGGRLMVLMGWVLVLRVAVMSQECC